MKSGELHIYGKNAVLETLSKRSDMVLKLYVKDSVKTADFQEIRSLATKHRIPINSVSGEKLDDMIGDDVNHQGVLALARGFTYTDLGAWLAETKDRETLSVIILDRIQDVQNFGAIVRSAAAFGMDAVIVGEHNQAPVTSAVFKTSAGALLAIPIIQAGNLNQMIETLKREKFWLIGLDASGTVSLPDYEQDARMAIVLGSEGDGIREKTRERCDTMVSIPISSSVESLNASVSAGLACYERAKFLGRTKN